jgi:ABC-type transport system involved in cytochrome bd biosynthesis fused ATPase/permease subunit
LALGAVDAHRAVVDVLDMEAAMSDQFWMMLGVVLPVLIVQVFQYLATRKNARESAAGREEIKAKVTEVAAGLDTIKTDKTAVDLMIAGAERKNIAAGIEIGKQQASGPMPLGK